MCATPSVVQTAEPRQRRNQSPMNNDNKRGGSSLDRRHLLQAGLAAAFAAPLGAIGAQAFAPRAIAPGIHLSGFPLCQTASDAPALTRAPRELKPSWNARAG